jgi:hypothetical protein
MESDLKKVPRWVQELGIYLVPIAVIRKYLKRTIWLVISIINEINLFYGKASK